MPKVISRPLNSIIVIIINFNIYVYILKILLMRTKNIYIYICIYVLILIYLIVYFHLLYSGYKNGKNTWPNSPTVYTEIILSNLKKLIYNIKYL